MYEKLKATIYDVMEVDDTSPAAEQIFVLFIMTLIILNVAAVKLETVESIAAKYGEFVYVFNIVTIILFAIEYLLRVWKCTVNEEYHHPIKSRIKYIFLPSLSSICSPYCSFTCLS
jgi:voltage-gated potassium channel